MQTVVFGAIAVLFLILYLMRRRGRVQHED